VTAQMGETKRTLKDILTLQAGAVLVLDSSLDAPVVLYVNGKQIARGEIVVAGKQFGIQITELEAENEQK
jgi:flagellar motor switch protein FliN/FliY